MARIALLLAALSLTAAGPAQAGGPIADAARKKCRKGYVLKTVKRHGKRVKVCRKRHRRPRPATGTPGKSPAPTGSPSPGGTAPAGGSPPPPTEGPNQAPPAAVTRDDDAGRRAMAGGDLKLERAEFGASGRTATYYRIWLWGSGAYKFVEISWNDVSGESCTKVQTGSWAFKEGYTFTERGGGTVVKVAIAIDGATGGDDLLTFANADPDAVYVGAQGVRFDRNPQIADSC